MNPNTRARSLAIAALLAAAGLPAAADHHWDAVSGQWSDPNNWLALAVPPANAAVQIGSTAAAENGTVSINGLGILPLASLNITDGMTLRTNNRAIVVAGNTTLSGSNTVAGPFGLLTVFSSRLLIEPIDGASFSTHNLTLTNNARIDTLGQAFVDVENLLTVDADSRVGGVGFFNLNGPATTLRNDGRLRAGGALGLTFRNNAGGLFDLDGNSGNGILDVTSAPDALMRIIGNGLSDSFSGTIQLSPGGTLDMDLANGWTADPSSIIEATTTPVLLHSIIEGGPMTVAGTINMQGTGGWLVLSPSSLTIQPTTVVNLLDTGGPAGTANHFQVSNSTTTLVNGGTFNVGSGATVRFDGPTTIRGGVFNALGSISVHGTLTLFGDTEWDGNVTVNGSVWHFGHASVSGPSIIHADQFVLSPIGGVTPSNWAINNALTLNTASINNTTTDSTNAVFTIAGGILGRLTLNLTDPQMAWTMLGTMNLTGAGPVIPVTRLAGSPMIATGALNVSGGIVQVTADLSLNGATTDIAAGSTLRTRANTTVAANTTFTGTGTLQNGPDGQLVLNHGVNLQQVQLTNSGTLLIGDQSPAIASVDRLASAADALWIVDIGGLLAGEQHDLLLVSDGPALLAGNLQVDLLALAAASTFIPQVGDEFTILLSLNGINGTFNNLPVSTLGSIEYHWDVLYSPNAVVLRLDVVVPEPGTLATLAASATLLLTRRRRAK